jgi:diguanylate cyclase
MRRARECGLVGHALRCEATWCHWLLAAGRAAEARTLAESLLAQLADGGALVTTVRVLDAAYRACSQLGLPEAALQHHVEFERLERKRTLGEMRAMGQLFVTRGEAMRLARRADEFEHRAQHDELTGLGNRSALQQRARHLAPGDVLALIDIDHFKQVNDTHGHAAGDAVLVHMARLLRDGTRDADLAARTGGEEFVLLLGGIGLQSAVDLCERLRLAVARHAAWPELPAGEGLTVSIGLTACTGLSLEAATRRADAALYEAKRGGRNRVVVARD